MECNLVCWHVWGIRQEKDRSYWTWLAVDPLTAAWASNHGIPTLLLEPWRARLAQRIPATRTINGEKKDYDATLQDGIAVLDEVPELV